MKIVLCCVYEVYSVQKRQIITDTVQESRGYLNLKMRLAYLSDIFLKLNELNLSLQDEQLNIFMDNDKIKAFTKKIDLWCSYCKEINFAAFPTLESFVIENKRKTELSSDGKLKFAFKELKLSHFWLKVQNEYPELSDAALKRKTELSSDGKLKFAFKELKLSHFWLKVQNEYPELSDAALKVLLPFATSYMCEIGLSQFLYLKSKYRNKLAIEPPLGLKLSKIEPEIPLLVNKKQTHRSH
ncbi:zinc finger BED domain-containing protein 5-like [Centruroides sculpturatus]|uniref:zinc finger BED domain-containing protein 5-like n=1 Tax=Centruroides sculpturatus TaxID=218467 RepID=UPI000C6EB447|nr:zinc finger BED domain-containing protein 5-like [Centruroides sculpturatus]